MTLRNKLLSLMAATALLPWNNAFAATAYVTNAVASENGNQDSASVTVIDTTAGKVTTTINGIANFPYAIALTPDGSKAYVAGQGFDGPGELDVIHTSTNTVIDRIPVQEPDDVVTNPVLPRAYVTETSPPSIGVVDTGTDKVIDTIPFLFYHAWVYISPDGKKGYAVADGDESHPPEIAVFDTATDKIIKTLPFNNNPAFGPLATAHTPLGDRAYVIEYPDNTLYENDVVVIDIKSDKVIATIPITSSEQIGLGYIVVNPAGTKAYTVSGYNNSLLYAIDLSTNKLLPPIPFTRGSFTWGMGMSPDGNQVYVSQVDGQNNPGLWVFDVVNNKVLNFIKTEPNGYTDPWAIGVLPPPSTTSTR